MWGGGRVAIKFNDQIGPYFPTYKGVRQGDPLFPLLFDIIADELYMLIEKAVNQGMLRYAGRFGAPSN